MKIIWRPATFLMVCLFCVVLFGATLTHGNQTEPAGNSGSDPYDLPRIAALPTVDTAENLQKLLEEAELSGPMAYYGGSFFVSVDDAMPLTEAIKAPAAAPSGPGGNSDGAVFNDRGASTFQTSEAESSDHSTTNLQVEGVDEADIIKNDGEYLYQVNRREIIVARIYPAESMQVLSRISFEDEFVPQELYLDENYLVVIGTSYAKRPYRPYYEEEAIYDNYLPYYPSDMTKALVFDLKDKSDLQKIREVELDGYYLSSRKIGSSLYLISNRYIGPYPYIQPCYRDTAINDRYNEIGYEEIHYFPGFREPNYLLVAGIDLAQPDNETQISAYLGSAQDIYVSLYNLYVAITRYQWPEPRIPADRYYWVPPTVNTTIYKFGLDQGVVTYKGEGQAPGTILNQFSMDEYQGYFRIATTTGDMWATGENISKNNIYILDENLDRAGQIEDIAPGERIYSARFMGDRGYLVTFKNVDPFFVLDLKDPTAPQILGALKIPGYSDYLHPYDEDHILAFGKETVELDLYGSVNAYYQGVKVALFDVSDVSNPVEMFKTTIGDRGTESDILHNHKALLFDREKSLLSFPVTLREVTQHYGTDYKENALQYGEFTFQGAYVYQLDLIDGFTLRGRITHLTDQDILKSGYYFDYYGSAKIVERIIYIGDTLYTISKGQIKANDLASLAEKSQLSLDSGKL